MSYFIGSLNRVRNIFLLSCPKVFFFFPLSIKFMSIFEPHKSTVQREESSYK